MTTGTKGFAYFPALDGLRGVAVLLVMGYHDFGRLRGGFIGVDVFFVLSGFLITSILLEERRRTGGIRLGSFYARRALRLYPALVAFVTVLACVARAWPALVGELRWSWIAATLLYVSDLVIAYGRVYPLGYVSHCWSLGVEEQFYLVWPFLVRVLTRRAPGARALLAWAVLGVAACTAVRAHLSDALRAEPDRWLRVYMAPDTRADAPLVGCAMACLAQRGLFEHRRARAILGVASLGAVAALGWIATSFRIDHAVDRPWLFSLTAVAAALVLGAARADVPVLGRALSLPPLVWIGRRSYGIYLWHVLVFVAAATLERAGRIPAWAGTRYVATFAIAALSYAVVERPFLERKRRFEVVATTARA